MRLMVIIFLLFFYPKVDAQIIYDKQHGKLVKTPSRIIMPKIIDADFCQKLRAINISDSISFTDEGRKAYYPIWINITFNKQGDILSTKQNVSSIKSITEIANQTLALLKEVKWKIVTKKSKLEIVFKCELRERSFKNILLSTTDNFQREKICN